MGFHVVVGQLGVAGEYGLGYFHMLFVVLLAVLLGGDGAAEYEAPHPLLHGFPNHFAHDHVHMVAAGSGDAHVEIPVGSLGVDIAFGLLTEALDYLPQALLFRLAYMQGGAAGHLRLHELSDLNNILGVGLLDPIVGEHADLFHEDARAMHRLHKAVEFQSTESFPHRDAADAKHLAELFLAGKLVAHLEAAVEYGVLYLVVNLDIQLAVCNRTEGGHYCNLIIQIQLDCNICFGMLSIHR